MLLKLTKLQHERTWYNDYKNIIIVNEMYNNSPKRDMAQKHFYLLKKLLYIFIRHRKIQSDF